MRQVFTFHRYEDKKRLEDKFGKFLMTIILVAIIPVAILIYQFTQKVFDRFAIGSTIATVGIIGIIIYFNMRNGGQKNRYNKKIEKLYSPSNVSATKIDDEHNCLENPNSKNCETAKDGDEEIIETVKMPRIIRRLLKILMPFMILSLFVSNFVKNETLSTVLRIVGIVGLVLLGLGYLVSMFGLTKYSVKYLKKAIKTEIKASQNVDYVEVKGEENVDMKNIPAGTRQSKTLDIIERPNKIGKLIKLVIGALCVVIGVYCVISYANPLKEGEIKTTATIVEQQDLSYSETYYDKFDRVQKTTSYSGVKIIIEYDFNGEKYAKEYIASGVSKVIDNNIDIVINSETGEFVGTYVSVQQYMYYGILLIVCGVIILSAILFRINNLIFFPVVLVVVGVGLFVGVCLNISFANALLSPVVILASFFASLGLYVYMSFVYIASLFPKNLDEMGKFVIDYSVNV